MVEFLLFLILLTLLFGASKILKLTKWVIIIGILCFIFLSLLYTSSAYSYSKNTYYLFPVMSAEAADGAHGKNGQNSENGQNGNDGASRKNGNGGNGGNGGNSDYGRGGNGGNGGDAE